MLILNDFEHFADGGNGENDRLVAEALHFVLIYKVKNCCMGDVKRYFIACDSKYDHIEHIDSRVLRHTRPSEGARHRQNCAFGRVSWTHESELMFAA